MGISIIEKDVREHDPLGWGRQVITFARVPAPHACAVAENNKTLAHADKRGATTFPICWAYRMSNRRALRATN